MADWQTRLRVLRRRIRSQRKLLVVIAILNILIWVLLGCDIPSLLIRSPLTERYLVNTPACQLIWMDPFSPSVTMFNVREKPAPKCEPPLIVAMDETLTYAEGHKHFSDAECCYQEIRRLTPPLGPTSLEEEGNVTFGPSCIPISRSEPLRFPAEFVRITCIFGSKGLPPKHYFYAKPPSLERHSEATQAKLKHWRSNRPGYETPVQAAGPPSVLIILLSAFSHNDFIRWLPQTREFLLSRDFVELQGYTKIMDHTLFNAGTLLTGIVPTDKNHPFHDSCYGLKSYADDCPFIWKNFSDKNYITGLFQDVRSQSYISPAGFRRQPTDYYGRPFTMARDPKKRKKRSRPQCIGGRMGAELAMDYILDFIKISQEAPYFFLGLFFELTRTGSSNLKPWDPVFKRFWEQVGNLSDHQPYEPVVLFISDEGPSHGYARTTAQGFHESNLPFAFIRIPPGLRRKFPEWHENLQRNAHSLTTPYDLHATLKNLLSLIDERTVENNNPASSIQKNPPEVSNHTTYSIFQDLVPDTRTCTSALIPEEHCNCGVRVSDSAGIQHALARELVALTVHRLNKLIKDETRSKLCVPFDEDIIELTHMWKFRDGQFVGKHEDDAEKIAGRYVLGFVVPEIGVNYETLYDIGSNKTVHPNMIHVHPTNSLITACVNGSYNVDEVCICRDYVEALRSLEP